MSPSQDHTFIIGDIHGCFKELEHLLKKAEYNPKTHRLILVGDLINKGPYSLKVLKWAFENQIESVIGNHELKFIHLIEQNLPLPPSFQKIKDEMGDQLENWIQYLKKWPTYIEEDDFMVVHAGLVPGEHPSQSDIENLVHIRHWDQISCQRVSQKIGKPWHEFYKNKKLVIYGHWARQGFHQKENVIGLDSGCVYGNQLTGVFLPSRKIIQIPYSSE